MNDKYWKCEYENLRRNNKKKFEYLKNEKEMYQIQTSKSIKQFFEFLQHKGISADEFIEFVRKDNDTESIYN